MLSDLPSTALCPPANRAARQREAPDQLICSALSSSFYVKSPSSSNRWPVCYCQGSSIDPAQSPAPPVAHGCPLPPACCSAPASPSERLSRSTDAALLKQGQAPRQHRCKEGPPQHKHQSPTCGCCSSKAEPSAPWMLLRRGARREIKDEASALNKCLMLQSRHLGYFRACLLSHTMYTLKKKKPQKNPARNTSNS